MKCVLKLFITGNTPSSIRAQKNLKIICQDLNLSDYEIQTIDVIKHPELAEENKIVAIPTLIKESPPPQQKIIGDLSDKDRVLSGLELVSQTIGE
ncbi:MAG: circadian clock protein KaiB [Legionellales bacterium]|nr:circadian clock protein KaiB [Legionellales bacterium]|tara:strand:- start:82076 stop:82360 length:285 start_codon:yes stop_codon:yes gene_type:complete